MAIKYGTNNVNDVVFRQGTTNYTVTLIKNENGEVLYARPGTLSYILSAGVTGHGSVERTSTLEPTASTGSVASQQPVYHGDELCIPVTAENCWTGVTYNGTVDLSQSTTHTVTLTAYRQTSTATIIRGSCIDSYDITYRSGDIAGTTVTLSGVTTVTATYPAWCGASMVITPVASTNYTCDPITKPIGWSNFTETLTGQPWKYPITIPNVANATTWYAYEDGSGSTVIGTAEGVSVNAWKNNYFTYEWTALAHYKITAGGTGTFKVTQASAINAPTVEMKVRTINFSNPNKAVILNISYTNTTPTQVNTTTGTYSNTSSSYIDAWSGGAIVYSPYNSLVPLESKYFDKDTAGFSATIAAADTEAAVNIDATLRTFTLGTYSSSAGTITYYTSSAKTQTISNGTYLDIYNKAYYVFTPPSGWYVKNGNNYVTQLSGYVTSTPANKNSAWYPNIDTTLYGKLTVCNRRRGAVYRLDSGTWVKILGGNLSSTWQSDTAYFPQNSVQYLYANYLGPYDDLDGSGSNDYATANDNYVNSTNSRAVTINSNSITVNFEGALKSRTLDINRAAMGSDVADVTMYYMDISGSHTSSQIVSKQVWDANIEGVHSRDNITGIWKGCNITFSVTGMPIGWAPVSGFNTTTVTYGSTITTMTYSATYDYRVGYGWADRPSNVAWTYTISNIPTTYSYTGRVTNINGQNLYITSPCTSVGAVRTGRTTLTVSSGQLILNNNAFITYNEMSVFYTTPPHLTCVLGESEEMYMYNSSDTSMNVDYDIEIGSDSQGLLNTVSDSVTIPSNSYVTVPLTMIDYVPEVVAIGTITVSASVWSTTYDFYCENNFQH